MRKVTVFEYEKYDRGGIVMPLNRVICTKGSFHQWGSSYEEFESGAGNYTVAIVELSSGDIITPCADMIRFDDPPPEVQK